LPIGAALIGRDDARAPRCVKRVVERDDVAGRLRCVISLIERSSRRRRTRHDRGKVMAKGQQRSNREAKKPKKQASEKANKELSPYKQSLQQQSAPGIPTKKP
jgi:hypothetical protein